MNKQNLKKITVSSLLIAGMIVSANKIVKADINTDTVNELWGKPTLVYGGGLSDEQVKLVNNYLNVKNTNNVVREIVEGSDVDKYLNTSGVSTSSLYSSVLVQKKNDGSGIKVNIINDKNITKVTKLQYESAAITAGAKDLEITVTSPIKVTGESALTGVYKAMEVNGEKVSSTSTAIANKEINTVTNISDENADKKGFDSAVLDKTLATIKTDFAKAKTSSENGEVSKNQIQDIVNKAIDKNGLKGIISEKQADELVELASQYNKLPVDQVENWGEQLKTLTSNIKNQIASAGKSIENSGVLDKIGNGIQNIWNYLTSLFNK